MAKQKATETKTTSDNTPQPQLVVGVSTIARPTDLPVDSILYEKDTGNRYRLLDNGTWDFIDNIH